MPMLTASDLTGVEERREPYSVVTDILVEAPDRRGKFDRLIWNDSSPYHISRIC